MFTFINHATIMINNPKPNFLAETRISYDKIITDDVLDQFKASKPNDPYTNDVVKLVKEFQTHDPDRISNFGTLTFNLYGRLPVVTFMNTGGEEKYNYKNFHLCTDIMKVRQDFMIKQQSNKSWLWSLLGW
jgi:hypothetical protein